MKFRSRIILVLASLGLMAGAVAAHAQDNLTPEFVQRALERTDMRIEQAEALVTASDNEQAAMHLAAAVELQTNAKQAFASVNLQLSLRLTVEAINHADRAIAIVRDLPDPERVRAQLERTQELLERAKEKIEECNNDRARAMLKSAFEMQARAIAAAQSGHYLVALQLTVSARERALKALRLCNLEDNLQAAAERAIHRTDDILSRAHEVIEKCDNPRAHAALRTAFEMQGKAKAEFRNEHFRVSLRLTQAARANAYRAIRICGRDGDDKSDDRVDDN